MSDQPAEPSVVLPTSTSHTMEPSQRRFPWGCVVGGCLTVMLAMVFGLIAVGVSSYWFYKKQVVRYTSEEAIQLPVIEASRKEIAEIEARVETFYEQVEAGDAPGELVLTADDLNALISQEEKLRGQIFITIEEGLIRAEVSIPTDAIPGAEGRFFNGTVAIRASLDEGILSVTIDSAEVNGKAVPEIFMRAIRRENLAKQLQKNLEFSQILETFDRLEVMDDKVVLFPRRERPIEAEQAENVDFPSSESSVEQQMK